MTSDQLDWKALSPVHGASFVPGLRNNAGDPKAQGGKAKGHVVTLENSL